MAAKKKTAAKPKMTRKTVKSGAPKTAKKIGRKATAKKTK